MLVSVHIPKCAGTSFRHILHEVFGPRLWLNYGTIFVRAQAQLDLVPPGIACIHGHFFADAFDDVLPQRSLITWLRHPVERVVSNYHHFLRSPDMRDDCCRVLHERKLSLTQFAELDWMRNEATRYMAGKSLSDFAFVGIAERFTASLALLARQLDWPTGFGPRRDNVNPERAGERYPLSTGEFDRIAALNSEDLQTYEGAVQRLMLATAAELDPA